MTNKKKIQLTEEKHLYGTRIRFYTNEGFIGTSKANHLMSDTYGDGIVLDKFYERIIADASDNDTDQKLRSKYTATKLPGISMRYNTDSGDWVEAEEQSIYNIAYMRRSLRIAFRTDAELLHFKLKYADFISEHCELLAI